MGKRRLSELNEGKHTLVWEGTNEQGKSVSAGVYFYKLETPVEVRTKKMLIVR